MRRKSNLSGTNTTNEPINIFLNILQELGEDELLEKIELGLQNIKLGNMNIKLDDYVTPDELSRFQKEILPKFFDKTEAEGRSNHMSFENKLKSKLEEMGASKQIFDTQLKTISLTLEPEKGKETCRQKKWCLYLCITDAQIMTIIDELWISGKRRITAKNNNLQKNMISHQIISNQNYFDINSIGKGNATVTLIPEENPESTTILNFGDTNNNDDDFLTSQMWNVPTQASIIAAQKENGNVVAPEGNNTLTSVYGLYSNFNGSGNNNNNVSHSSLTPPPSGNNSKRKRKQPDVTETNERPQKKLRPNNVNEKENNNNSSTIAESTSHNNATPSSLNSFYHSASNNNNNNNSSSSNNNNQRIDEYGIHEDDELRLDNFDINKFF